MTATTLTDEEVKRFAEALVKSSGVCMDAEITAQLSHTLYCSQCPFYCHLKNSNSAARNALELAERYLLDLEVRSIIEEEYD